MRRTTHGVRFDQQQPRATVGAGAEPAPARRLYVSVTLKFALAQALAASWLGVAIWLSLPWVRELAAAITIVPAILVVSLVAYLPGWLVAFLAVSLLLPLTLVVNAILYRFQRHRVFNLLGLRVRRNALGFLGFVLTYQMLMSRSPWSATGRNYWDYAAAGK